MTDIEIANSIEKKNIKDIASSLNLSDDDIETYGKYKAKITKKIDNTKKGKLILVTAVNPTPYGEGKTTVSIGLADALNLMGKKTSLALREPSLGPVFGVKGGATGGGYSQVVPMEDINLHFTGDFHAITAANNLLSSAIDNHIFQGNELNLDKNRITFYRTLDVNDRALRNITINIDNDPRKEKFQITAASEIMALFCLASDIEDLKNRLGNIIIGYNTSGKEVYAKELHIVGALTALLKDAFYPNLVQTLYHTPAIIHGGPFANIAHGCNSIVATKTALSLSDYVVTEAGFGSDLGAEKFFDIKCPTAKIKPDCVVLTVTTKALKYNGGAPKEKIYEENLELLSRGIKNLEAHLDILKNFDVNIVVAINKYKTDSIKELEYIMDFCEKLNVEVSITDAYSLGGKGAISLAEKVLEACNKPNKFKPLYNNELSIMDKINTLATKVYHAKGVIYNKDALEKLKQIENSTFKNLPVCIAKTPSSISDDSKKLGYPKDYDIVVRDIVIYNGAGFITVLLGNILTMPGLPKKGAYYDIDVDDNGNIVGIF